jgi:hypothetical protein
MWGILQKDDGGFITILHFPDILLIFVMENDFGRRLSCPWPDLRSILDTG